jgi:ribokinase
MLMVQFEVGMAATLAAARIARRAGVPVLLNPAPVAEHPAELLEHATVIVANEIESAALAPGAKGNHEKELAALRAHAPNAVITLGEHGSFVDDGRGIEKLGAFPVVSVDSVGAGDAFCAALAIGLIEKMSLFDAARFASAAGALAVTAAGAQASLPSRRQVEALLGR